MSDDLAWVERNYGNYTEYCRQREENAEYEAEQEAKAHDWCARNKAKLEAAGERAMYFCEDCFGCKFYEDVGPTCIDSWGYQDDVPHGICHHKDNPFRPCKGREEGEYNATRNDL